MRTLLLAVIGLGIGIPGASMVDAAWNPDSGLGGVPVCTTGDSQYNPAILEDGAGGAFLAWTTGGELVMQWIDRHGNPLWAVDGVFVTTGADVSGRVVLVPDGLGGVIALWGDNRIGVYDVLYAQRVNGAGVAQWAAGGVAFSSGGTNFNAPQRYNLSAVADGVGGAVICWEQFNVDRFGTATPSVVRVQRISNTGAPQWGVNGVGASTTTTDQTDPGIIRGDLAEAIVTWSEARSGSSYVFAQRFNVVGVAQWTANGVFCSSAGSTQPNLVSDGAGGAILAFSWSGNIGAKRVLSNGFATWGSFGFPAFICVAAGNQYTPELVADGVGGAVIVWHDERNAGSGVDLFAQRVDAGGAPQWTVDGVSVVFAPSSQAHPRLVSDGASGAMVSWTDFRGGINYDIYAGRLQSNGTLLPWNGAALSTALDTQYENAIAADARGGAIVAWHDYRKGDPDIFAQRIDSFGYVGDPSPRITSVADVPNDQGGKVRVSWAAGYIDDEFAPSSLTYEVWRKPLTSGSWVLVGTQARGPLAAYSLVVPTLADSGAANAVALFRVDERLGPNPADPFWTSEPATGYSVDNLVPQPPSALSGSYADGVTQLQWQSGGEIDLAGYRIYRADHSGFVIGPERLIGEAAGPYYEDPAGAPYAYQVTAVDRNGNESAASAWAPAGLSVPADGGGSRVTLAVPRPNPARTAARLEFSLPREGQVTLIVADVSGRRVCELAARHFDAGAHAVEWDLRDAGGARVAPGMYFVRLHAASGALVTRALAVVR